jgi:hypothetical protein
MRKFYFMLISGFMIIVVYAIPSYAYRMADYWAFNKGNVWIYDRDLQVMGIETHNFAQYTGRQFLQAREFCNNQPYIYNGSEGVMVVGIYNFDTNQFNDLSAAPIKLSNAEMTIGDSVTNNIPAGVVDDNPISITITLEAVETITVPAGTYYNTLRMRIFVNDGVGTYTEKVWLAKGIGAVQMYRESETNNTPGCFFTCGSFSCGSDILEQRYIKLKNFIKGKRGVVVIPLN